MRQSTIIRKSPYLLAGAGVAALMLAAFTLPSLAAGGGHGAGGGAGGVSGEHSSSQGLANSNGPNSSDRDKGLARSEDRRSDQAADKSKAPGKHKTSGGAKKKKKAAQ